MAKRIYEGSILVCMAILLLGCLFISLTSSKSSETIIAAEVSATGPDKVVFKSTSQLQAEIKAIRLRENPQLFKNVK